MLIKAKVKLDEGTPGDIVLNSDSILAFGEADGGGCSVVVGSLSFVLDCDPSELLSKIDPTNTRVVELKGNND